MPEVSQAKLLERLSVLLSKREREAAPQTESELTSWVARKTLLPPSLIAQALASETLRLGDYVVTGRLGRGGMGAVLKARAPDGSDVAIKLLQTSASDTVQARFEREALALSRLDHPGVVRLHAFEHTGDVSYLVLEYVPGVSLERRLARDGAQDEATAWALLSQTTAALGAAEQAGILHRDVKPGNILWLPQASRFKVCDFGIARFQGGGEQLTAAGTTLGTPVYMSPEQAMGNDLDARSDMYSLGMTLHEVLTGVVPFEGASIGIMLTKRVDEDVPSVRQVRPAVSAELAKLIGALTRRNRDDRPPTWAVFSTHLAQAAERAGVSGETRESGGAPAPTKVAEFDPDDSRYDEQDGIPQAQGLGPLPAAKSVSPGSLETLREPAIGEILGDYRLDEVIGRGGMGVVYRATKIKGRKTFAVKVVVVGQGPEGARRRERFEREVEALRRLDHENLVRVYTYGRKGPHDWYAMDLVEGTPLDELLRDTGPDRLDRFQKLTLFMSICKAVTHAHEHNVIHRDLKPANVLVGAKRHPYVLDFGLAKLTGESKAAMTRTGAFLGTPYYMAPEQFLDPKNVDLRIDVFSLGVVLYEMLTGQRPFDGETSAEISYKIMREKPVRPSKANPKLDPSIDGILLKALEKDPNRRYASVAKFRRDVHRFRRGTAQAQSFGTRIAQATGRFMADNRRGVVVGFLLATLIYVPLGAALVYFFTFR